MAILDRERLRVCWSIVPGLFFLGLIQLTQGHEIPREIPKHMQASVSEPRVGPGRTIAVTVNSRSRANPDSPDDLQRLRQRAIQFLARRHFMLSPSENSASFLLEVIVEPNVRYGMFHYQNAPYVYLTVRDVSSGHLVYCAYQRAGVFLSATNRLLREFAAYSSDKTTPDGSIRSCAEEAKRSP